MTSTYQSTNLPGYFLKVDRKLKRRQKRRAHYDRVLASVQGATCPSQLLFVLIEVRRR